MLDLLISGEESTYRGYKSGAWVYGMIGSFSRAPVYFIVSTPPKMIDPGKLVNEQEIWSGERTFSNIDTCKIETECSTVGNCLGGKLIDNIVVGRVHSIAPTNSHDALHLLRARRGISKLLGDYLCTLSLLAETLNRLNAEMLPPIAMLSST